MLIVVVTLFAVCWLPLHVFNIMLDFVPQLRNEDQPEASSIVIAIFTSTHWLAMSNSFVNPIIYGFLNDSFRVTTTLTVTHPHRPTGPDQTTSDRGDGMRAKERKEEGKGRAAGMREKKGGEEKGAD